MYDIITFGSATRDTFLKLEKEESYLVKDPRLIERKAFHFPLGSKIEIEKMLVFSGGGGTNSAATFANRGFKTAYVGKVGRDKRGEAIIEELKKLKIETEFVQKDKKFPTAYSLIVSSASGERTIFVFRGASYCLGVKEIPWEKLKAKWFYLAALSGGSCQTFIDIVNFARKNKIRVACNPGNSQIKLGLKVLKPILRKIDILSLNLQEASLLTGISFQKEKEIIKELRKLCPGIIIITQGKKGAVCLDNEFLYSVPVFKVKVAERTGAGDAFSAGFLAEYLQTKNTSKGLQFAAINAGSCVREVGAKNGLLKKGEKYPKLKIKKQRLIK